MFKPSKDAILLNEAPKKCPKCNTMIPATTPKLSTKAWMCVPIGIALTAAWMLFYFLVIQKSSPESVYTGEVAILLVIHAWPAYLVGFFASKLPQVIERKCFKCAWRKTYEIKLPKIS